jgi:cobalt-zinc-cadmium efflux system outer membrane protein
MKYRSLASIAALLLCAVSSTAAAAAVSLPDTLTIADAVALVSEHNRSLRAANYRTDAAQALVEQAARRPNPGLSLEAENIAGNFDAVDPAEYTLGLSQMFEIGGKRSARTEFARAIATGTSLDRDRTELLVVGESRRRFHAVLLAEARLALMRDSARLAAEIARVAGERASAGAALASDATLSRGSALEAEFAVREAETAVANARRSLAVLWGDVDGFANPVSGSLTIPTSLPPADSLVARIPDSPAFRQTKSAVALARAGERVAHSLRMPNLVATGGVRRLAENDATTFLVGVEMPLPLFDRNQDGIAAATQRILAAEAGADSVQSELASTLHAHRDVLARLIERHDLIDGELIPAQTSALDIMRRGYDLGRVSAPDLLEAQRRLVALGLDRNDTRRLIAEELIAIEVTLGIPWNRISGE